ncbi:MAG: NrdH-redoxin [Candidatus Magasanikbacteria bacterium]|uniref:NrdH-redoxin n=1 Tax=Candidatus Magasanikbacteria bacterium CG10_big_fil_rev_8_21_14_0_10_38_6 TaxID=1974647 RepID=A0A2M6P014_9BACT|nr:NrdH-redoxin [Candidatus Magasanikbacteria bacterium]NCS72244.1 NrdH-redoxin [Candidatus Magasanikbacteria bacterium]PIR77073.1 MAG: NrdH-redoxin [Candidatus Magasanikbacteria bacterium CG10_big_fil_rev_8_21_14_0_10_38_6]
MSVIVYSTPTCPFCHKAKEYLQEKHVKFEDINVAEDMERQQEMIEKSGQMSVPVLDIHGTVIIGFDVQKIDLALGS